MTPALVGLFVSLSAIHAPATRVRFVGNHDVSEDTLAAALDQTEGFRSVMNELPNDALRLLAVYYDRGFCDATVGWERLTSDDGQVVTGVFHIHEGATYRLGKVEIVGDVHGLARGFPASGELLVRSTIVRALEALRDGYQAVGRAPRVTPITSADRERHTIDLRVEIALDREADAENGPADRPN